MSITWKLRDGLKWSDGSDVTSNDVVFTWRYCIEEHTGCVGSGAFTGVETVEATDDYTVKITFDQPTPYPYTAFVSTGAPIISEAHSPAALVTPLLPASLKTPARWAPAHTGSSASSQTRRQCTSATPTTAEILPTLTR